MKITKYNDKIAKTVTKRASLRLLRTFAGVLREKYRVCAILEENMANYISLERLIINVDFRKKISIAGFFNSAKENRK